jgi:hypothetical protein
MVSQERTSKWMTFLVAGLILWLTPCSVRGEDYGSYATVRAVEGTASLQASGDGQLQALVNNLPLLEGDTAWTDSRSRVDLLLQDGNHLQMDGQSRIEIDRLPSDSSREGTVLRLRLWKGSMLLDMRSWNAAMSGYLVSTPSAMVSPSRAGLYLVEVESVDRTRATCIEGLCMVASAGESVSLAERQATYAEYGYPPLTPMVSGAYPAGLLKFRSDNLPRRAGASESRQYLPENLSAWASDLDSSGDWTYDTSYGYVWRPDAVAADWAPYTYGQWAWNSWGMTWVPYEPWGWAPYHYGRWVYGAGYGWGWCPMAYFAPAWVSFSWIDGGYLGWCALDYWGNPCWGPSGWNSCTVGNIYNTNLHNNIVHRKDAPPPSPIYPRAQGSPGYLQGGGPRGAGSANLSPQAVRAYRDGRLSDRDIRSQLGEPLPAGNRRAYPSIQGGDRNRGTPGTSEVPVRRDGGPSPAGRAGASSGVRGLATSSGDGASVREPRRPIGPAVGSGGDPSIRGGRGAGRDASSTGGGGRSLVEPRPPLGEPTRSHLAGAGRTTGGTTARDSRSTPATGTKTARPPSASRTAREPVQSPGVRNGGDSSGYTPGRSTAPRAVPRSDSGVRSGSQGWGGNSGSQRYAPAQPRSGSSSAPRYIPSRPSAPKPSSGVSRSAPAPSKSSGGGHKSRK